MAEGAGAASWVFLLAQVPSLFAIFNPSPFFDVRKNTHEPASVDDVRRGYLVPTAISLSLGMVIAVSDGSPVPLLLTTVACAAMIASYEWSIANPVKPRVLS